MLRLEAAMVELRPGRVEGVWHRFVAELYKDDADSDQGALENGGRYNPRREFGALYLSESPAACRAENCGDRECVCGTGMRA
ncbi:MAG: RES domain-containing protein [Armatimonadota bacterium]